VLEGAVKKADVLWYLNGRDERETIVHPAKVIERDAIG
jgi:hypothetical protein